ncbi:MAG: hypothetical protein LBC52_06710 [Treponema sp.]|jgi:hypothetical protein|nr:hypothetical protein [Treponema sp.]
MKKKNSMVAGTAALVLTLVLVIGCPQENNEKPSLGPSDGPLVSSISVAGVNVSPLPAPGASMEGTVAGIVVVSTERPPRENEIPTNVYYQPVQPVAVQLADANSSVFFEVTAPGELPVEIVLPPGTQESSMKTRTISITRPNTAGLPEGQDVWLRVLSADESKTEFYRISVVNKTHDITINSLTIQGYDVMEPDQTRHLGAWGPGTSWAEAVLGLVSIKQNETANLQVFAAFRNDNEIAKPRLDYAKILTANANNPSEPVWSSTVPSDFSNGDILGLRATASNGHTIGYIKVKISVGGSPFLASLTVDGEEIVLGNPSADIKEAGGAFRVEKGRTLTGTPVNWAVNAVPVDVSAAVSWAIVAKGNIPGTNDFNKSTMFSNSANYLYIKVVSQNGEFTVYYLVVYDERPKDTEHIKVAWECAPIYRFTIPEGKSWADLGPYPKFRLKVLEMEDQFDLTNRNFIFGELSLWTTPNPGSTYGARGSLNTETLSTDIGRAAITPILTLLSDRALKDWALTPAVAGEWYTVEYPILVSPTYTPPWATNDSWVIQPGYKEDVRAAFYPLPDMTGDVYWAVCPTHEQMREYYIKEIILMSDDEKFQIPCDLLGNGRIDSNTNQTGFVIRNVPPAGTDVANYYLREMVADPTLK